MRFSYTKTDGSVDNYGGSFYIPVQYEKVEFLGPLALEVTAFLGGFRVLFHRGFEPGAFDTD
jgi:hypothetical protein